MVAPMEDAADRETPSLPPEGVARLLAIMARLRDPKGGCPWDIAQDFDSIAPYTIEEAYEVADAIARRSMPDLCDELGDLLLQVVYHAQMADEAGAFGFDAVVAGISAKMLRRHPHVFGPEDGGADGGPQATGPARKDKTAAEQSVDWEAQKAAERRAGAAKGALDGVALGLPGLTRAVKLQKRAARVGFDWGETQDVLAKIVEEAGELAEARETLSADAVEDEFGDLLFVMANLARHLSVDPEAAIRRTNAKFTRRFGAIEARLAAEGRRPEEASLAEMDALWDAVKAEEKRAGGGGA